MLGAIIGDIVGSRFEWDNIKTKESLPAAPMARDEMDADMFNAIMQKGLDEAKANHARPASEVFVDLRREL